MKFAPTSKQITDALRYMGVPPESHTEELVRTVSEAFGRLEGKVSHRAF